MNGRKSLEQRLDERVKIAEERLLLASDEVDDRDEKSRSFKGDDGDNVREINYFPIVNPVIGSGVIFEDSNGEQNNKVKRRDINRLPVATSAEATTGPRKERHCENHADTTYRKAL